MNSRDGGPDALRNDELLQRLRPWISPDRLDAYARRLPSTHGSLDVLAAYAWNTALSRELYPCIQSVEVALRNSLHAALSSAYGTSAWFRLDGAPIAHTWQRRSVARAESELHRRDGRRMRTRRDAPSNPSPGRVVAELNFGFWVGFFNDDYDPAVQPLWRGDLLTQTFPNLPPDEPTATPNRKTYRNRRALSVRLNRVLALRNRISHHEPIWYWRNPPIQNLGEQHNEIRELLTWFDPVLRGSSDLFDDFAAIYGEGPVPFRAALATYATSLSQGA